MTKPQRVVILGGHGKIALLATPKLKQAGFTVDAVIRNPDQRGDVENAGGRAVILDMESASVDELAKSFAGAAAIVFSAGAGGGNPKRTRAVDYQAAVQSMQAAEQAGVKRYVMISFARLLEYYEKLDSDNSFYPYCKAKFDADAYLRETPLDYTILGPGFLTKEAATETLQRADDHGAVAAGADWPDDKKVTSRENTAAVIAHVIQCNIGIRETLNFYDGDIPLAKAFT